MNSKSELTFTLLSDGSSDRVLTKILTWIIKQHLPHVPVRAKFGDLRQLPNPPRELYKRMETATDYYTCDILFVHRDAEKHPREVRVNEISEAWRRVDSSVAIKDMIPVIPVRMTEAWLLFDEDSIKIAAGNPNYSSRLSLPSPQSVENLTNPKHTLHELIKKASGLRGRKLNKLKIHQRVHIVAEHTEDFSPLRVLPAFQKLEEEIKAILTNYQLS